MEGSFRVLWTILIELRMDPYFGLTIFRESNHIFSYVEEPYSVVQAVEPFQHSTVKVEGIRQGNRVDIAESNLYFLSEHADVV